MSTAFAMEHARPAAAEEPAEPYVYDPTAQLNRLRGGGRVIDHGPLLGTATQSSAGSKTHSDDTDV